MNVKDQFKENPFLKDDPRYEVWALISHAAMEDDAELRSQILKKDPTDIYGTVLDWFTGCFDKSAKIGTLSVWSYQAANDYNAALPFMIDEVLSTAREWCPRNIVKEDFLLDLQVRLLQRQAHWERQALRYAREVLAGNRAKQHGSAQEASKLRSDGQGGSETLPKLRAA